MNRREWRNIHHDGYYTVEEYWKEFPTYSQSKPIVVKEINLAFEIADALNEAYKAGQKDTEEKMFVTAFNYPNKSDTG